MNPCDCGYYQSKQKRCVCARVQIEKYQRKMNSPLFQRFDMCIFVQSDSKNERISQKENKEKHIGKQIAQNILRVRGIQIKRQEAIENSARTSSDETKSITLELDIKNLKDLQEKSAQAFKEISARFLFSRREEVSLLRVARTIADLDESKDISEKHLFEALSYRLKN